MSNELPKKKRYVLSDGRIAYCFVNPNFIGLTKSAIEQLIEYIILTNGECIVEKGGYLQSKYTIELVFDDISVWVSNYPYSYGHVYCVNRNTVNPFKVDETNKEIRPSDLHKKRLNELLIILKKLGRISDVIKTYD